MTPSTETTKRKIIYRLISAAFWILIWQAASAVVKQELILPSPLSVFRTFISLCVKNSFWISVFSSLLGILEGFIIGVIIGTLLAALTVRFELMDALFSPILRIVRSTPVASFIILALLWIGKKRVPGLISALMVMPVVCGAVQTALSGTDKELVEMAKAYRFGKMKTIKLVYIPSAMPSFKTACVTSLGLAWKSGIAAEVLCQPKNAIGSELYYSKIYLETPALFAWTAVVIILSFLFELAFTKLVKGKKNGH